MKLFIRLLFAAPLFLFLACESENWNLVDPPAGRDSVMVRYLNFCGDGAARTLVLDGTLSTQSTPDTSVSSLMAANADSAFVSVRGSGSEVLSVTSRMHFAKQSNILFLSVPSIAGSEKKRALDTVLQFSTTRAAYTTAGYGSVRLIVAADDSITANYEMRVGCPNGTLLGSPTSVRQSTAFINVPQGDFVVSLLRNSEVVGVYKLNVKQSYFYSLVAGRLHGRSIVRCLDEFNATESALVTPAIVQQSDRQAYVRVINFSTSALDSVVTSSGTRISSSLSGSRVGSYKLVSTCLSDQSDQFQLYSGGSAHQQLTTSLGVLARYTLICFDSAFSTASALAMVPPTITPTPADSVTVRIVNALPSGRNLHVRLGARNDAGGRFKNGEVIATSTAFGTVSKALRISPGIAPITVLSDSSNDPEALLCCALTTLEAGKEYLFVVGRNSTNAVVISRIDATEENASISSLEYGVYTQVVNARADRLVSTCTMSGLYRGAGLSFGATLATVCPQGNAVFDAGYTQASLSLDSSRRLTLVLGGDAASPSVVKLDTTSMLPALTVSRSRYLNLTKDVPNIALGVGDLADTTKQYRPYIDQLLYGRVSPTRSETNPTRVNFVCIDGSTNAKFYTPDYPLTLGIGKAYTLIVCGSKSNGYALILQQEY